MSEQIYEQNHFNNSHKSGKKKLAVGIIILIVLGISIFVFKISTKPEVEKSNIYENELKEQIKELDSIYKQELNDCEKFINNIYEQEPDSEKFIRDLNNQSEELFIRTTEFNGYDHIGNIISENEKFFYDRNGIDYMAYDEYKIYYDYFKKNLYGRHEIIDKLANMKTNFDLEGDNYESIIEFKEKIEQEKENLSKRKKIFSNEIALLKKNKEKYAKKRKYKKDEMNNKLSPENLSFYNSLLYNEIEYQRIDREWAMVIEYYKIKFVDKENTLKLMDNYIKEIEEYEKNLDKLKPSKNASNDITNNLLELLKEKTSLSKDYIMRFKQLIIEKEIEELYEVSDENLQEIVINRSHLEYEFKNKLKIYEYNIGID